MYMYVSVRVSVSVCMYERDEYVCGEIDSFLSHLALPSRLQT